jgi:hypothetical protein
LANGDNHSRDIDIGGAIYAEAGKGKITHESQDKKTHDYGDRVFDRPSGEVKGHR